MARIREVQRMAVLKEYPVAAPSPRDGKTLPATGPDPEAYSFIEVGGGIQGLDASADVLACPAPAGRVVSADKAPNVLVSQPESRLPTLTEAEPLLVELDSWPAGPGVPAPEVVAYHHPDHPASQQYRTLLTQVKGADATGRNQIILFTGMTVGAGTTTVLLNLAVSAARSEQERIAILDLHTSRPAVATRLGIPEGPGLQDVIAGRIALEKAIQPSRLKNLFVLAPQPDSELETVATKETVHWLLGWLRRQYDLILVDSAAWEGNPFLSVADAVFLVAGSQEASPARTPHVAREIARQGGSLRGLIHTGFRPE
jgi:hypothetical protein